jgi:phage shock protein C
VKKLTRSRDDRILAGVCGGAAAYFGIPGDVVRVIWIGSLVLAGIGVLPYLAAIFLLPESGEARARATPWPKVAGFALLALGVLLFFRTFDARVLDPRVLAFWKLRALGPVLLVAAGALLVWPGARAFLGASRGRPLRSVSDRVLGGVAGGIARELQVDPNVVRLAFTAAAGLTFGLVVLVYLLLLLILPEEPLGAVEAGARLPGPPAAGPGPGPGASPGQATAEDRR